jgi:hypothetical protein
MQSRTDKNKEAQDTNCAAKHTQTGSNLRTVRGSTLRGVDPGPHCCILVFL